MSDLRPFVELLTDLPTLPAVAGELLRVLSDPATSAADITQILSRDMALSARLLRAVNSPFYGFSRRIHSIAQAVVIVGFQHLRTMALSVSVIDVLGKPNSRMDYRGFWRHALASAIWARELVRGSHPALADSAYLAGLLHDVGKLTLGLLDDAAMAAVVEEQRRTGELFLTAERAVLSYDHTQLGASLLERWNFPEDVTSAVARHHRPPDAAPGAERLTAAVHMADILTRAMLIGWGGDARLPRLEPEAWRRLETDWDRVERMVPSVQTERRRAESFLRGDARKGPA